MKFLYKLIKNDDGAVMVIVALALVVLLGCMALVVDAGVMYVNKAHLQNVADAAALAGAQELPDTDAAEAKAIEYGTLNGVVIEEDDVKLYDDDKIEVVCRKTAPYLFAKALGSKFKEADVSARAVAQNKSKWDGEVLPFLVTDNTLLTKGAQAEAWDKVDTGYFQCLENYTIENNVYPYDKLYFNVKLDEGLQITNGKVANKKTEIGHYFKTHDSSLVPTPYVYIFSVSPKAIATDKVTLVNGTKISIGDLDKYNKKYFKLENFVLIKCTFDFYSEKAKLLYLTSVETYDLGNDDPANPFPDYPEDYVNPKGGGSTLVK